jgi:hypothetical protein
LPRRLGDDPLARARNERAKAAQTMGHVGPGSEGRVDPSQPGTLSSSRPSYNDVFYQRRAEGSAIIATASTSQVQAGEARVAPEAPEISEISELPEIREVSAPPAIQASLAEAPEAKAAPEGVQDAEATPVPPISWLEETSANLDGTVAGVEAPLAYALPEMKVDDPASLPAASQAPDEGKDQPKVEPQDSSSFFKRLFNKAD